MMNSTPPISRDVVLIGGGHAHALMLRQWAMRPVQGVRLTVINPAPTAPYTGMLPGFVAGHYDRHELDIDLVRLTQSAGARLILGLATGIDRDAKRIAVTGRPDVAYDIASIDIGITSSMDDLPGFAEHAVAAKPLGPFSTAWDAFRQRENPGPVAVIGGGIGGVELALAMKHRLGESGQVAIIEAETVLSGVTADARTILCDEMSRAGIKIYEGVVPIEVTSNQVKLSDDTVVASEFTVGAAGARAFGWLKETGLELENGYVRVDANLRSLTDPTIHAVGDCAHIVHAPRPKAGVFAVRAAPVLTHNIAAELTGGSLKRFDPQSRYLKLISLGRKAAVADKYRFAPKGAWAWNWKDRIDRAFMDRLNETTPMRRTLSAPRIATASKSDTPLCGGCGAKVGSEVLDAALEKLDVLARNDVETGSGDDAAVLTSSGAAQVITTDHLRAFWPDPFVMSRIAMVHALSDVLAMGANPQAVLAQITLPHMTDEKQAPLLEEILVAANDVASSAGATLVGGHTTMGAELTLGFTVTGLLHRKALTLSGAKPGDALVLTKPIGSGTILAAAMQGEARGADVANCIAAMSELDLDTAEKLAPIATALTDVTGFGLAGHALRMARASNVTLEISLSDVPLYEGAAALAEAGTRSTIYPANRRAVPVHIDDQGRGALLFDPQTSGGLLAAVPNSHAKDFTVIGRVLEWAGEPIRVI